MSSLILTRLVALFCLILILSIRAAVADLNAEEAKAIVIAKIHHAKPNIVQSTGESVGLVKYCPSISTSEYQAFVQNSLKWIKLGSSEFENLRGSPGFLNNRLYRQLKSIFDNALSQGERDARIMRSHHQYKRELCPKILDNESLNGPPTAVMRLIVDR